MTIYEETDHWCDAPVGRGEELLLDAAGVSGGTGRGRCHSNHPAAGGGRSGHRPARGSLRRLSLHRRAGCRSTAVRRGHEAYLRRAVPRPGYLGAGTPKPGPGAGQAHPGHLPGPPDSECDPGRHPLPGPTHGAPVRDRAFHEAAL